MAKVPPQGEAHDYNCLSIDELEKLAAERMHRHTREYYNEGADHSLTLRENKDAYNKYRIRQRVLRDVSRLDSTVDFLGRRNAIPLGVGPTAMQCLAHEHGEEATARACQARNIVMGLSSFATKTLEEVAAASGDNTHVLQLYLFEEREHSEKLIQRAKRAGFKAVFFTVDTPQLGRRNLEIRNQFKLPDHFKIANFAAQGETGGAGAQQRGDTTGATATATAEQGSGKKPASQPGFTDENNDRHEPQGPVTFHTHAANPTLHWGRDIEWVKEQCYPEMKVYLKGITTAEDALLAVKYGVDGILVSNHGGRQLDGTLATIDALPEIATAVKGRIPVHVDGGIRHGSDVFKALALGADFVWIGRPTLWGLAYKGQQGVETCLRILIDEFRLCMSLAGCTRVSDINRDYLAKVDASGFVSRL